MHKSCSGFIHVCLKLKATNMSFNWWVHKQAWHVHTIEHNSIKRNNMLCLKAWMNYTCTEMLLHLLWGDILKNLLSVEVIFCWERFQNSWPCENHSWAVLCGVSTVYCHGCMSDRAIVNCCCPASQKDHNNSVGLEKDQNSYLMYVSLELQ